MGRDIEVTRALTEYESIIEQEVRRFRGTLTGYDRDDLRQECRIAVSKGIDPNKSGARTYARLVARNHLTRLLRRSTTLARCPHDDWGRPRQVLEGLEQTALIPSPDNPESTVTDREVVTYLSGRLDAADWRQLVSMAMNGARYAHQGERLQMELVRQKAGAILRRIGYRVRTAAEVAMQNVPEPDLEAVPCHALGEKPQGYDPNESECHDCRDKFTCLPAAIDGKLVQLTLKADLEVAAVLDGSVSFMDVIGRMKRRFAKRKAGEKLTVEETTTWEGLLPREAQGEAPPPPVEEDPAEEAAENEDDGSPEAPSEKANMEAPPAQKEEDVAPKKAAAEKPKTEKAVKPAPVKKPEPTKVAAPAKATKPAAVPAKAAAPSADTAVVKDGVVKLGNVKLGEVRKGRNGWGWYGADGQAESPTWLATEKAAVAGLEKWARSKGPLASKATPTPPVKSAEAPKVKAKPAEAPKEPSVQRSKNWPTMANGKPLPSPNQLTEEEMVAALKEAQSKLGANIRLEYGMQLVRRKREGDVCCTITPHGFEYEVDKADAKGAGWGATTVQLFSSLSSVAMWAEKRMVSGNDFFNLAKNNNTEVRDKEGRVIDRKGGIALRR